jgi:hypothetical protein
MSGDRLDRGFVTWQGRRVFVPWFGPPRLVESAEDEVRVLKNRLRLDWIVAVTVVPFLAAGAWIISRESLLALVLGLWVAFGVGALIEGRRIRDWPRLTSARLSRNVFLWNYFRRLPLGERLGTLWWSGLGAGVCLSWLWDLLSPLSLAANAEGWSIILFGGIFLSVLMPALLALRQAAIVLLALLPVGRQVQSAAQMAR